MSSNQVGKPPTRDEKDQDESYPSIQPGASLLLALRLAKRPILLIGGGLVASQRLYFLLESDAEITLISPGPLHPSIQYRIDDPSTSNQIKWLNRPYLGGEDEIKVKDFDLVMTAIDDNELSKEVCELCRKERVMVNVADIPPQCDFYFGAQLRKGPLQILISTGGLGPRAGAMIRDIILNNLPENIEDSVKGIGLLRSDLRKRAPGVGGELGQKRMDWMKDICDKWGLDKMKQFNDDDLRNQILDQGWENDRQIIGPDDLQGHASISRMSMIKDKISSISLEGVTGFGLGVTIASLAALYMSRRGSQ
ncbi:uncharacterized protein L201_006068 [Kwoniella dendrophila CBS 6074]|uniref:precorrin-2 dehydrogenase n=1 Tax=Kwoniella dendrophila CBS 6074 TaxID=1295534 RepID=A0AAX4K0M9_9TREE